MLLQIKTMNVTLSLKIERIMYHSRYRNRDVIPVDTELTWVNIYALVGRAEPSGVYRERQSLA